MLRTLIVVLTLGLTASFAQADTREERLGVAKQYITETMKDVDIDAVIEQMWMPLIKQARAKGKTFTDAQLQEISELYKAEFTEPMLSLMRNQADTLADIFTLEEIVALKDFYKTSAGRAVMKKLPKILEAQQPKVLALVQQKLPRILPKLREVIGQ